MFPLGNVLLPHQPLALQVFEPRYHALVERCRAGDGRFGVVLIERGSEVGGGETRFPTGVVATIEDVRTIAPDRLGVVAVGQERCRVRAWLSDDPYPRADVEVVAPDPPLAAPEEAAQAIQAAWAEFAGAVHAAAPLDAGGPTLPVPDPDPLVAVWQVLAWVPVNPIDVYGALDEDDPSRRIGRAVEAIRAATDLVRFRLG
jgi:Lon protease-like protein